MTVSQLVDQTLDFDKLSQKEQVKLMAYFLTIQKKSETFTSTEIKESFHKENLKEPANVADCCLKLSAEKPPKFLKRNGGFVLERVVKKTLDAIYLNNPHIQETSKTLRDLIPKLLGSEQQRFLEEAISCFEIKSYRAAIVMTWLLAIDTVYEFVIAHKLVDFNLAVQSHGKYKKITFNNKEQFTELRESDFLEILRVGKIITDDVRKILKEKLDFRNTCAHPNTIVIKSTKAISFIEDMVENVISKF